MSYFLRRAHGLIWLLLVLVVPTLLYLSLSHRPTTLYDLSRKPLPKLKGNRTRSAKSEHWRANLRIAEDEAQLELLLNQTLAGVACIVSIEADSLPKIELGAVRSKGVYRFRIPLPVAAARGLRIRLVDPIQPTEPVLLVF